MARSKTVRLIAWDAALVPAPGEEVCCTVAGPLSIGNKEPAGHKFHLAVLKQSGVLKEETPKEPLSPASSAKPLSRAASAADLEADQPPPGVDWKGSKKKKKKKSDKADLYALLGLQNERWTATEAQMKLAYRRTCLEHHPDKKLVGVEDEAEKERINEHFKAIQSAYATLSDPAKRREYDSTDTFDDSLPTDCAPEDFFAVFAPAFRRNARWSVDSKVPDIGDASSPWETVDKFYRFWFSFKSWREFPHEDEEDVEGAECREHRRWIERNNAKLRERGKKEEGRRLRDFVDAAYRIDPRVTARKEAERLERERIKQEKADARKAAAEAEAAAKAAAEAAVKAAEEAERSKAREERDRKEAAKKEVKQARARFRALCNGRRAGSASSGSLQSLDHEPLLTEEGLEALTTSLTDAKALMELNAALEKALADGDRAQALALLREKSNASSAAAEAEAAEREEQKKKAAEAFKALGKNDHATRMAAMGEWNDEELRMLDRAVSKFPIGTPRRWEQVAAYVRTRTLDEVLLMVKDKQGASGARLRAQEDWKGAQKNPAQVKAAADSRATAFTDVDVKLQGAAAALLTTAGSAASDGSSAASAASEASASGKPPAADGAAKAKKVVSADSGEWNEEQELALVKAMKIFGKELEDRWDRVAGAVPGKTKAQCFRRFKELREVFKAKKGGAGGDE